MRNLEKDEIEMAKKRERMLTVGFRIFSEKTIEVATMKEIAKTCNVGYKTMFRYFGTKTALVIAIGAEIWKKYAVKVEEMYRARGGDAMNAAEERAFFRDCFIDLYQNHKDILRFIRNFETYTREDKWKKRGMRCMVVRKYLIYFQIDETARQVNIHAVIYGKRGQAAQLGEIVQN